MTPERRATKIAALRVLADMLDADDRLPVPDGLRAWGGSGDDGARAVLIAAEALDRPAVLDDGSLVVQYDVSGVLPYEVFHVNEKALDRYKAETSYNSNLALAAS